MLSKGESKSLEDNTNTDSILQIKNISKIYYRNPGKSRSSITEDEYKVLNNINLDIKGGEFVTIIGPSGCGKSTLLTILAGIDKEYSVGGEILFNDGQSDYVSNNSSANSTDSIQDKILIFQEAALFPWLTVMESVEFGLKVAKVPKEKRKAIAEQYIEMVQLSNFVNSYVHQLSGGMEQRVAISRALVLNSKILLMDEPFAALDVNTRQMLQSQLLQIHQTTHKTILFVTHNITEAVTLGDRVVLFSRKRGDIKKQFEIRLPHPRNPDHPIVDAIIKEIMQEFKEFEQESPKIEVEYNNIVAAAITGFK